MKAGIVVDDWKLPVFRRHLEDAGFEYEDGGPVKGATTLLTVQTYNILSLKAVLEKAEKECQRRK